MNNLSRDNLTLGYRIQSYQSLIPTLLFNFLTGSKFTNGLIDKPVFTALQCSCHIFKAIFNLWLQLNSGNTHY